MERARAKDDSKALNRLFKLAVFGSALIVTVYSVYYYSNAYKYSKTNIYFAEDEADILVKTFYRDDLVGYENVLYTANQQVALGNSHGTWQLVNATSEMTDIQLDFNARTSVAMCGVVSQNFDHVFADEMIKKFTNIPPVLMDRDVDGIVVKSIQFEHFAFPVDAMINWRDKSLGYKTFSFETDSMPGNLKVFANGFEWHPGNEEYVVVLNCEVGDSLGVLRFLGTEMPAAIVNMPIADFDIVFNQPEHLGASYQSIHTTEPKVVIQSEGEM